MAVQTIHPASKHRAFNFNAGPAAMPQVVLEQIQDNLLDYQGRGLSVLEMSHRSSEFEQIAHSAESRLRQLLNIPNHYKVLFMQGGASAQFAYCINNLDNLGVVSYANTGYWSKKAIKTANSITSVREVASCSGSPKVGIPVFDDWLNVNGSSFLHITDNETIDGVVFEKLPDVEVPIVADMSSSILSQPIDVERYGMIYAGAQKNIGPAGITIVIINENLLERSASSKLPDVFNYAKLAETNSMLNTPPTFAWYAAGLVFQWLIDQGGLSAIAARNQRQAKQIYAAIDRYSAYHNNVMAKNRSLMNIPFSVNSQASVEQLLAKAEQQSIIGLKGHKSVGGLRASLYNAVTDEAVLALENLLVEFAEENS